MTTGQKENPGSVKDKALALNETGLYTQRAIAEHLGVTQPAVWEHVRKKKPHIANPVTIKRLAIDEELYTAFDRWCFERKTTPTRVIRLLMKATTQGRTSIESMLENKLKGHTIP